MKHKNTLLNIGLLSIVLLISTAFAVKLSNQTLPWEYGILDGDFELKMDHPINKVSGRTIEGSFRNNQKEGSWKLFDKNHKLIQKRIYKNSFEYTLIEKDKEVASSFKLKRGKDDYYLYDTVAEKDVASSRRMWLVINDTMLYQAQNISRVLFLIDLAKISAYKSDKLETKVEKKELKLIDWSHLREIQIMGDWFYNSKRKLSEYRILAIRPVPSDSNIGQVWYYYPDLRSSFAQLQVESENPMIHSLDDLFYFGEYPYLIYMVENVEEKAFEKNKLEEETIKVLKENILTEVAFWISEK
jgi:hypothetical protein